MPVPIATAARLRADLDQLAEAIEAARFGLGGSAVADLIALGGRDVSIIRRYLEPRLAEPEAPPLVAVFGPTGSGKSTIVNSIAGRVIGSAGVIRPTTRHPLVWSHPRDADRYRDFEEATVVTHQHPLVAAVSLVDTPDLDSYLTEHRSRTEAVLDRCDAAIFVTTPQRYADAVPWEALYRVIERRLALLVVVNRLSRRSSGAVNDLASMLRDAGVPIRSDDVVKIQEQRLKTEGLLAAGTVRRIDRFVRLLDPAEVVAATVAGSVAVVVSHSILIEEGLEFELHRAQGFADIACSAISGQVAEFGAQLDSGDLVRLEVIARWQRMAGVQELASLVSRGVARIRDLARGSVDVSALEDVSGEIHRHLVEMLSHRARLAYLGTAEAWRLDEGSAVGGSEFLLPMVTASAEREVADWLGEVVRLVGGHGRKRFRVAKAASVGVNVVATVALIGVFAHTGGLTGAEMGLSAGAAAAQQAILEHVFGAATASRLAREARDLLLVRAERVIAAGVGPLLAELEAAVDSRAVLTGLTAARTKVESAALDA